MLWILIGTGSGCFILALGLTVFAKSDACIPLVLAGCVLLLFIVLSVIINELISGCYDKETGEKISFIWAFLLTVLVVLAGLLIEYLRPTFDTYRIADTITKTEKLSEKTTKITEIQIIEKRKRKIFGSFDMTSVPKYEEEIKERIEFSEGENK